ncbi:MAG: hypothetical protein PHY02_00205 [Phycisphaerae bacterium]|nr:hypothetical protein [Phycisphaerae bacterium]
MNQVRNSENINDGISKYKGCNQNSSIKNPFVIYLFNAFSKKLLFSFVIPAKAGIQIIYISYWIPAFAGMTSQIRLTLYCNKVLY